MNKGRLKAFSDGMIAIFITIMVLGSAISYTILTVVLVNLNGGIRCWPRQWDMISKARYR